MDRKNDTRKRMGKGVAAVMKESKPSKWRRSMPAWLKPTKKTKKLLDDLERHQFRNEFFRVLNFLEERGYKVVEKEPSLPPARNFLEEVQRYPNAGKKTLAQVKKELEQAQELARDFVEWVLKQRR